MVARADEECGPLFPAAAAAASQEQKAAEARLLEQQAGDDGAQREARRLPELCLKLQQELSRKEQQLRLLYDRQRDRRLEVKRAKDRSVRTVEGYNEAWFAAPVAARAARTGARASSSGAGSLRGGGQGSRGAST